MNTSILLSQYARRTPEGIETIDQIIERVVTSIAEVEQDYSSQQKICETASLFREIIERNLFWPSGRILNNAGSRQNQLASCFVLPLADDFNSIFETLALAAHCHRTGGGTGFDLSNIREEGAEIASSEAAGAPSPITWLRLFDAETLAVMSGGKMRGANIAALSVYHPDIMAFVGAKAIQGSLSTFNLSVRVDDRFMTAVQDGGYIALTSPYSRKCVREIPAREIWDAIVYHSWSSGDPGIIFTDEVNRTNVLRSSFGPILCPNPCGEQLMYPFESSILGSLNLASFYDPHCNDVDWELLRFVIHLAVRMLDDAIDLCTYPDTRISTISHANRRIGVGVMGYADLLVNLNLCYDSAPAFALSEKLASFIQNTAWDASAKLAQERGVFPNFQYSCLETPVRNCAVTAIAPTGTISMLAECSSGIEPRFSPLFVKDVVERGGVQYLDKQLSHYLEESHHLTKEDFISEMAAGWESVRCKFRVPERFCYAFDVTVQGHVSTAAAWQRFTDNGISKTVNLKANASLFDVETAFHEAWRRGCKGITVYRQGSQITDVLKMAESDHGVKSVSQILARTKMMSS